MKNLIIYDIDDTIFFGNQPILLVDDEGNTIGSITNQQYHEIDVRGERHLYNFSWETLEDADNFIETLKPNNHMIEQMIKDLEGPDEVLLLTARSTCKFRQLDIPRFREGFHMHGMNIDGVEIIFAGDNLDCDRPSDAKRVEFERLFGEQYDSITIYDDSELNLKEFWLTSLDYPFTTTRMYHIQKDGTAKLWHFGSQSHT